MLYNLFTVVSFTCSVFAAIKHCSLYWPRMKASRADVFSLLTTSTANLPSCLFPLCVRPWASLQFTRWARGQQTNIGAGSRKAERTQSSGAEQRGCWITVRMIPLQRPLTTPHHTDNDTPTASDIADFKKERKKKVWGWRLKPNNGSRAERQAAPPSTSTLLTGMVPVWRKQRALPALCLHCTVVQSQSKANTTGVRTDTADFSFTPAANWNSTGRRPLGGESNSGCVHLMRFFYRLLMAQNTGRIFFLSAEWRNWQGSHHGWPRSPSRCLFVQKINK